MLFSTMLGYLHLRVVNFLHCMQNVELAIDEIFH